MIIMPDKVYLGNTATGRANSIKAMLLTKPVDLGGVVDESVKVFDNRPMEGLKIGDATINGDILIELPDKAGKLPINYVDILPLLKDLTIDKGVISTSLVWCLKKMKPILIPEKALEDDKVRKGILDVKTDNITIATNQALDKLEPGVMAVGTSGDMFEYKGRYDIATMQNSNYNLKVSLRMGPKMICLTDVSSEKDKWCNNANDYMWYLLEGVCRENVKRSSFQHFSDIFFRAEKSVIPIIDTFDIQVRPFKNNDISNMSFNNPRKNTEYFYPIGNVVKPKYPNLTFVVSGNGNYGGRSRNSPILLPLLQTGGLERILSYGA